MKLALAVGAFVGLVCSSSSFTLTCSAGSKHDNKLPNPLNPIEVGQAALDVVGAAHADSGERGTGTAKVKFRGREIEVVKGELLRTALMRRQLSPHNGDSKKFNCRASSICGTCAVHIKGKVHPAEWNIHEQARLRLPPFHDKTNKDDLRLACQVEVVDDIEVIKNDGVWGELYNESDEPADDFQQYLGEGEFWNDVAESGFNRPDPKVHKEDNKQH